MKTLIVCYSLTGNTDYAATRLAQLTGGDLLRLTPKKAYPDKGWRKFLWGGKSAVMAETPALEPYDVDLARYDAVVLASPVWASRIAPPLRTFVVDHREELKDKPVAALLCMAGPSCPKASRRLRDLLGAPALAGEWELTDPKDKPDEHSEEKLRDMADALNRAAGA
ncbi:MAG: flavodoxin [Clostridia bacterium]|nr:flavodoxin [Clostridia bacterium]